MTQTGAPRGTGYKVIYADPAWTHVTWSKKGKGRSPEQHYKCMTLDEIKAIPVSEWCDENCVLLIWTLDHMIPQALEVIEAWGFTFKTVGFNWVKLRKRQRLDIFGFFRDILAGAFPIGMGYWTRANPELCLLATRGKPKRVDRSVRRLVVEHVREHSRKPDRIRDDIVRLCGDVERLEMFTRTKTPGWDFWGNETDKFDSNLLTA